MCDLIGWMHSGESREKQYVRYLDNFVLLHEIQSWCPIGSLSMRVFETRTATGFELFYFLTCLHTNHIYIAKYLFSIRDD